MKSMNMSNQRMSSFAKLLAIDTGVPRVLGKMFSFNMVVKV